MAPKKVQGMRERAKKRGPEGRPELRKPSKAATGRRCAGRSRGIDEGGGNPGQKLISAQRDHGRGRQRTAD